MSAVPRLRVACLGFVFDPLAQEILREIAPPEFELSFAERQEDTTDEQISQSDLLLVVAPVTDAMMQRARRLRFIQKWGTGYEKIDTAAAERHGITVAITAGANADTIAEHAVTLMLTVMRRVATADRAMREGRWIPGELRGVSRRLHGKTVGIIGFGNIGRAVARQVRGFDCTVLYYKPSGPVPADRAEGATFVALPQLLADSDVITLHAPGAAANRGMIGRDTFDRMKPGAVLINVARGDLVVEADLVAALQDGRLAGAGLDVYAAEPLPAGSPLRALDNVVLTPHSAGSVLDDVAVMGAHAFANMLSFVRGEEIRAADLIVRPRHSRPAVPSVTEAVR